MLDSSQLRLGNMVLIRTKDGLAWRLGADLTLPNTYGSQVHHGLKKGEAQ